MNELKSQLQIVELPIHQLKPGRSQPRRVFDEEGINSLANSIRKDGIQLPIQVRKKGVDVYEIIAGERRWRAAQKIPLESVPCIIKTVGDEATARIALTENLLRKDLNPIEEAEAYQALMDEFGHTHQEIAEMVGKSRPNISNTIRLLSLTRHIRQQIIDGIFTPAHGKALVDFEPEIQEEWARRCIAKKWTTKRLERELQRYKRSLLQPKDKPTKDIDTSRHQRKLSEFLNAPVTIVPKGKGYTLMITCYSLDEFEGVVGKMGYKEEEMA